jgi:hypothetical protein
MADATGETREPLRVAFDRRLKLEFHGTRITSDGGLLAYRELDDALGLTATGASALAEGRRGRNIRHRLLGLLRQAIYGRLAGYEDVNDAARLARDPAMRAIVGREGLDRPAASSSQSPTFGQQEGSAYNGHFRCTCFSNRAGRVKSLTSRSRRGALASLRGRHGTAT